MFLWSQQTLIQHSKWWILDVQVSLCCFSLLLRQLETGLTVKLHAGALTHRVDYMQTETLWMLLKCKVAKKKKKPRWNWRFPLEQRNEWMNELNGSDCNWAYFWVLWPHSHLLQKSVILNLFIFYLLWDKDGQSSVNVAKIKTTMHWCQVTTV